MTGEQLYGDYRLLRARQNQAELEWARVGPAVQWVWNALADQLPAAKPAVVPALPVRMRRTGVPVFVCEECGGRGRTRVMRFGNEHIETCIRCGGTGKVV